MLPILRKELLRKFRPQKQKEMLSIFSQKMLCVDSIVQNFARNKEEKYKTGQFWAIFVFFFLIFGAQPGVGDSLIFLPCYFGKSKENHPKSKDFFSMPNP